MGDGSSEGNDGRSPGYKEQITPPTDAFVVAVTKIQEGNAANLTALDYVATIGQLMELDPTLINPFLEKGRSFLSKCIETAGDPTLADDEKISHLNTVFYSEVATIPGDLATPLDIQIMNLGAFAFVGEHHEMSHPGSVRYESEEVNTLLREAGQLPHLTDNERAIINALATGMEIGYGLPLAVQKLGAIINNVGDHVEFRDEFPEVVGNDFLRALFEIKR